MVHISNCLFNLCVISNCNSCLVFTCYARADFSDSPCHKCLLGFSHLISITLDVWPPYTSPHLQGMQYMPDVLGPRSSMISLKVLIFFFTRVGIVLILCLASSLVVRLDMEWWCGSKATPAVFLVAV